MKKRFGLFIVVFLIFAVCATLFAVDLNKYRRVYNAVSAQNPLEGSWTETGITSAYINHSPVGVIYSITLTPDLVGTGASIDIPAWKHWGKIGSYRITVTDTAVVWVTTDDSVCVYVGLNMLSADGETHLLSKLADSSAAGNTRLGGETWVNFVDGEIDLTTEQDYWERLQATFGQSSVAAVNDTCSIRLVITLPYSDQYLETNYYKEHEVVR